VYFTDTRPYGPASLRTKGPGDGSTVQGSGLRVGSGDGLWTRRAAGTMRGRRPPDRAAEGPRPSIRTGSSWPPSWLADKYGRRRVFLVGLAGFGITAAPCGIAPSLEFPVIARLIQGASGALLIPGSPSSITAALDDGSRHRRGRTTAPAPDSGADGEEAPEHGTSRAA
jgi:hypothetical protein